jgi:hypothetical protein
MAFSNAGRQEMIRVLEDDIRRMEERVENLTEEQSRSYYEGILSNMRVRLHELRQEGRTLLKG